VVAATDANGKTAGILLRDASTLDTYRELGFRFIGLGSDGAFVVDGLRSVLDLARA
jgi:2-keto-3-deoxy-L-rhamnonate aldolase RhmA